MELDALRRSMEEIQSLKDVEVESHRSAAAISNSNYQELQVLYDALKVEYGNLQLRVQSMKESLALADAVKKMELDALERSVKDVQGEIHRKAMAQANSNYQELQVLYDALKTEYDDLQLHVQSMKESLASADTSKMELGALERSMEEIQSLRDAEVESHRTAMAQANELQARYHTLKEEHDTLQAHVQSIKDSLASADATKKMELAALKKSMSQLQSLRDAEVESHQTALAKFNSDYQKLQVLCDTLKANCDNLQSNNQALMECYKTIEADRCELQQHVSVLQEMNKTMANDTSKETTESVRRSMLEAQEAAISALRNLHEIEVRELRSQITQAPQQRNQNLSASCNDLQLNFHTIQQANFRLEAPFASFGSAVPFESPLHPTSSSFGIQPPPVLFGFPISSLSQPVETTSINSSFEMPPSKASNGFPASTSSFNLQS
ncbi:hypothetical protein GGU10DRAFT_337855, partial [Lentinula aff. detonsa]